ncbi:bile acid:sodium symporter family protein [Thiosulfativibrio zosterae]|uniref:Bile acid:sodium symporter n=1 Tax=Thiosulfativibrio zosterae TaxID=2675053 RepID=A0A6F8PMI5_9GAMM|nr:bile acid:sodium symporter family protein [Thiosulfativibrio zosterae]BBP43323.1 bile acid:sodium symporter [Thiosulfativibrio zosterae]
MSLWLFPVLAIAASCLAFLFPELLVGQKSLIFPLLILIMLGMGMTLKVTDFISIWRLKKLIMLGVGVQFLVMPLAAWGLAKVFQLPLELLIGLVLVGSTAGGTASNVMAYLAKGNVALSVSMTLTSTILAIGALPLLTWLLLGQVIAVPTQSLFVTLLELILLPLILGMAINYVLGEKINIIQRFLPGISMLSIVWIIAIIVALNHSNLYASSLVLVFAVMLHNLIGMSAGYWVTRAMGYDSILARTLAIEVGMQNSGLSVALALKYFTPMSALPGALFSIWHNVSGAIFASYCQKRSQSVD